MTTATFTVDTTTNIPNPERGTFVGTTANNLFTNSSAVAVDAAGLFAGGSLYNGISAPPMRLMRAYQDLPASGAIPGGDITTFTASMNAYRSAGMKAILRFRYSTSEASLTDMQIQANQIAAVLEANKDVVYLIEAGFLATFGEWADPLTISLTKATKAAVKDIILGMAPIETPVCFTQIYPPQEDWYAGQSALGASEAFNGSNKSRHGFHSDCFLTGNGDSFFYTGPGTTVDFVRTKTRAEQRAYVKAWCRYAPFGGETCINGTQMRINGSGYTIDAANGGPEAGGILAEGPAYSVAYLNFYYAAAFWQQWNAEGATLSSVYRQLGYRFQFDDITHPSTTAKGNTALFVVNMRNTGWAGVFSPRRLMVRLDDGAGHVITGYSVGQLRQLPSQATVSSKMIVAVPIPASATAATYNVQLEMPDYFSSLATTRAFKIQPANTNSGGQTWDNTNGRWITGTTIAVT